MSADWAPEPSLFILPPERFGVPLLFFALKLSAFAFA
jgi:hypothetical protein